VVEAIKANKIELQAGDVAVCATQLWDIDILNIRTEAKTGYDPSSLGRPMRVSADHDLLIEELTKRGVLIAYAKLTEHPELQEGTAAATQRKKTLENMFERMHWDHKKKTGLLIFDLLEGVDDHWRKFETGKNFIAHGTTRPRVLQLTKRATLPKQEAHERMAKNIWTAVQALCDQSSPRAGADTVAALSEPDDRLSLALPALSINKKLKFGAPEGARTAVRAIMTFLRSTEAIKQAGGLRLYLYALDELHGEATLAAFDAAIAEMEPQDQRLVLVRLPPASLCDPASRDGVRIAGFVHEIQRRGDPILKGTGIDTAAAAGARQLKERVQTAFRDAREDAKVGTPGIAYMVPLPPDAALGAEFAIAVQTPSRNADFPNGQLADNSDEAEAALERSYRVVLEAFAERVL